MAGNGTPPEESTSKIQWRCADVECLHERCDSKVMWSDTGHIEIRGEIRRNPIDGKFDWSVRVDHYGTSDRSLYLVEAEVARYARRMAAQLGMVFRGPKVVSIHDPED